MIAAVVIGGGGVLAGSMAEGLARAGANIIILDLNLENATKKANELIKYGIKSSAIKIDASRKEDLRAAADQIVSEYGEVNIVINAPGINSATPFFDISEEEWQSIINVNLKSLIKMVIEPMRGSR